MPWRVLLRMFEAEPLAGAVDLSGRPLSREGLDQLEVVASSVNDELIELLAVSPDLAYQISPRKFEELVAELYRRQGFEVTLTPASGDGGSDVYVVESNALGRSLTVVQAKRYAAHRKVGVGVVRELLGTINLANASAGMILTTSFYTRGALKLEEELPYRISLRNYFGLQDLLRQGLRKP